jgi:hypothetical protein
MCLDAGLSACKRKCTTLPPHWEKTSFPQMTEHNGLTHTKRQLTRPAAAPRGRISNPPLLFLFQPLPPVSLCACVSVIVNVSVSVSVRTRAFVDSFAN